MFDETPDGDWGGRYGWRLVDTREKVRRYPYTFFVPSRAEIDAIEPGEHVKLEFKDVVSDAKPSERMWVIYQGRDGMGWYGDLCNQPHDLEGLNSGQRVRFMPNHIASVMDCKIDKPNEEDRYLARAYIDPRILRNRAKVGMMARVKRWRAPWRRSPYGDTGWQVFAADLPALPLRAMDYTAIGLLLNLNDAMLPLLNAPFGARIEQRGDAFVLV